MQMCFSEIDIKQNPDPSVFIRLSDILILMIAGPGPGLNY